MRNYDKEIAMEILRAQIASDNAKCVDGYEHRQYYKEKDWHINKAIKLICQSKSKKFRFSVQYGKINQDSVLVYFTYNDGENRYQVSFHNFQYCLQKLRNPKYRTHWDKGSSRVSAFKIFELVD